METGNLSEDYRPLILVAEDDDSNFKLIKAIIGKKCEILWAKNGEEMVNLFKENRGKTAAILMDIKMPNLYGYGAFEKIREFNKTIPIIAQTSYSFPEEVEKIKQLGFNDFISKPLDKERLYELVKKYFNK